MGKIIASLIIVVILASGCSGLVREEISTPLLYNFIEPLEFPFEVTEKRTQIATDNPKLLHQFVFHYKNIQTTQEIKYILSKSINRPEKIYPTDKQPIQLENGVIAYYQEDEYSQSIWWERDDGFLARFVYYVNENQNTLDSYKLDPSDLVGLANQVQ